MNFDTVSDLVTEGLNPTSAAVNLCEQEMLLSMHEMVVWLGLGPFEAFLHSFGLLVFSLLLTLRIHGVIDTSSTWHFIFTPLYLAIVLDAYYNAILYTRMVSHAYQTHSARVFTGLYLAMVLSRLAIFLYAEIEVARLLDGSTTGQSLIPPLVIIVTYLTLRLVLLSRTLIRAPF